MVPEDKLVALLGIPKATDTAAELIKAANVAGGQDNITAVVVGDLPEPPILSRLTAPRNLPKALGRRRRAARRQRDCALALSLSGAFRPSEAPVEAPPAVVEPTKKPAKPPTAAPADAANRPDARRRPHPRPALPPVAATPTLRSSSGSAKATPGKPGRASHRHGKRHRRPDTGHQRGRVQILHAA